MINHLSWEWFLAISVIWGMVCDILIRTLNIMTLCNILSINITKWYSGTCMSILMILVQYDCSRYDLCSSIFPMIMNAYEQMG